MHYHKVLLTGSCGMLASDLIPALQKKHKEILGLDLTADNSNTSLCLNICDRDSLSKVFIKYMPDVVIHLAAMTDVDFCEVHRKEVTEVNLRGTQYIAELCALYHRPIVYVSSASIFSGEQAGGYNENDIPGPANHYAKTKLESERIIQKLVHDYFIIRAGWMVGGYQNDKKFVGNILKRIIESQTIMVVYDKVGSLTFTNDLSRMILVMLDKAPYGIYHCVNGGFASRLEIAEEIISILSLKEKIRIIPVESSYFHLVAPRPNYECLKDNKLKSLQIYNMPSWKDSLRNYLSVNKVLNQ